MRHLHELPEQVCDSIRFQPHTFNASAFEHTGTCSCLARKFRAWAECGGGGGGLVLRVSAQLLSGFIYETDVESCEPASGTLTFFRVNETGIELPSTTTLSPSSTLNSSEVEKILNHSAETSE